MSDDRYQPFIVHLNDMEVLLSIFTSDDGTVTSVEYAERQHSWDTWSPPIEAVRA